MEIVDVSSTEVGLRNYSTATHRAVFSFLKNVFIMSVKSLESVIKITLQIKNRENYYQHVY